MGAHVLTGAMGRSSWCPDSTRIKDAPIYSGGLATGMMQDCAIRCDVAIMAHNSLRQDTIGITRAFAQSVKIIVWTTIPTNMLLGVVTPGGNARVSLRYYKSLFMPSRVHMGNSKESDQLLGISSHGCSTQRRLQTGTRFRS